MCVPPSPPSIIYFGVFRHHGFARRRLVRLVRCWRRRRAPLTAHTCMVYGSVPILEYTLSSLFDTLVLGCHIALIYGDICSFVSVCKYPKGHLLPPPSPRHRLRLGNATCKHTIPPCQTPPRAAKQARPPPSMSPGRGAAEMTANPTSSHLPPAAPHRQTSPLLRHRHHLAPPHLAPHTQHRRTWGEG
eukprot:COSAG01_NODE_181_length_22873_cov_12.951392_15_plen_188_part_00